MPGGQLVRARIINQIRAVVTARSYPPSLKELADAEGQLVKAPRKARGIRIVEEAGR